MSHLVNGATCKDTHLRCWQIKYACTIQHGVNKHRECAKYHHRSNGHSSLIRFGLDGAIYTHHCSCTTNGTTTGCKQGDRTVHFEQSTDKHTQQDGTGHHNGIYHDGGQSYCDNILKREFETIEDDTKSQDSLAGKSDAWHPCIGQLIAQTVGIQHTKNNTYYQRTKAKRLDQLHITNVKSGTSKECHE